MPFFFNLQLEVYTYAKVTLLTHMKTLWTKGFFPLERFITLIAKEISFCRCVMLQMQLQVHISKHHAQLQVPITIVEISALLCACRQGINGNGQ